MAFVVACILQVGSAAFACTIFMGSLRVVAPDGRAVALVTPHPILGSCPESLVAAINASDAPDVCATSGSHKLDSGTYQINLIRLTTIVSGRYHHECMLGSRHTPMGTMIVDQGTGSGELQVAADAEGDARARVEPSDQATVCVVNAPGGVASVADDSTGIIGMEASVIIV